MAVIDHSHSNEVEALKIEDQALTHFNEEQAALEKIVPQVDFWEGVGNYFMSVWCKNIKGENVDNEFYKALNQKDLTKDVMEMQWYLRIGANPNTQNQEGHNVLHLATLTQNLALAKLGLKYGTSLKAKNHNQRTPLQESIQNNHSRFGDGNALTLEYLKAVDDIFYHDKGDFKDPSTHLFSHTFANASLEVVDEMFVQYMKASEKLDADKKKALMDMMLKALIFNGKNAPGNYYKKHVEVCLKLGANPNGYYDAESKTTYLHHSKKQGSSTISSLLLTYGADPMAKDKWGQYPL